jgi:hypothetical protein
MPSVQPCWGSHRALGCRRGESYQPTITILMNETNAAATLRVLVYFTCLISQSIFHAHE